jgi:hypothetical protein
MKNCAPGRKFLPVIQVLYLNLEAKHNLSFKVLASRHSFPSLSSAGASPCNVSVLITPINRSTICFLCAMMKTTESLSDLVGLVPFTAVLLHRGVRILGRRPHDETAEVWHQASSCSTSADQLQALVIRHAVDHRFSSEPEIHFRKALGLTVWIRNSRWMFLLHIIWLSYARSQIIILNGCSRVDRL